jgi:hypothetical protein
MRMMCPNCDSWGGSVGARAARFVDRVARA